MPLLQVDGLCFAHAGTTPLFDGWSASWPAGVHGLGGESGSGKTTLLRLLAGHWPCRGRRWLDGLDFDGDPPAWRRAVCLVDPGDSALDGLSPAALRAQVHGQVQAPDGPAELAQLTGLAAWQRHIDGFALTAHLDKTLQMLSTGMRRKAVLAAVLSAGATLTLLDEPLAGLDGPSIAYLLQVLDAEGRDPGRLTLVASGAWPASLRLGSWLTLAGP